MHSTRWIDNAALWAAALLLGGFAGGGIASAADEFAPNDISIGEPLQLPFQRKTNAADPLPRRAAASPAQAAGTGWLGLSVDDSLVTGRLVIVEVTPQGPAAGAGIAPRDTLLAINGTPLRSADELAAALAAISPGMDVKMAIGKGDRVDEVMVTAAARPRESAAPPAWQAAAEPQPPASAPATPAPAAAPPAVFAPPAAAAPRPQPALPPAALAPRGPAEPLPAPAIAQAAPAAEASGATKGRTALGVRTVPVDSAMQARFQLPEQSGAFVIGVVHDLPASKAGVPPGSVIVALGNQPVRDPADLTRLVTSGPVGAPVPIQFVMPGGEARRAEVMLQPLDVPLERALIGTAP